MNPKRRSPYSAKVMQLLREEFFLNVPDATEAHWRRAKRFLNSEEGRAIFDTMAAHAKRTGVPIEGVETIRGTATEQWVKRLIEAHFRRVDDRSRGDDD